MRSCRPVLFQKRQFERAIIITCTAGIDRRAFIDPKSRPAGPPKRT
jgi:hypothetical protein